MKILKFLINVELLPVTKTIHVSSKSILETTKNRYPLNFCFAKNNKSSYFLEILLTGLFLLFIPQSEYF